MGFNSYRAGQNYILPRDESELARLNVQHAYLKLMACDGKHIYDDSVRLSPGCSVLDSGTGTGAWLMDLSNDVPPSVELHGCDVSPRNFPRTYPPNMQFHEYSCTRLPEEWTGKFDVVNQRMLLGALLSTEWPTALSEIMRVLKPGGYVQFIELDLHNSVMGSPAVHRFRDLSVPFYEKLGLVMDVAQRLPRMVREAGFVDVTAEKKYGPVGKAWGKMGELGSLTNGGAVKNITPAMVKVGVMTEEEAEKLHSDLIHEFETLDGIRYVYRITCARKPLDDDN